MVSCQHPLLNTDSSALFTKNRSGRKTGVVEQSFYRWSKIYCGMKIGKTWRLKEPEKKNGQLNKPVAALLLDNTIRIIYKGGELLFEKAAF